MRIPIGVFDFASYAIPGTLFLTWLLWTGATLAMIPEPWAYMRSPSLFEAALGLLVSYLLGHIAYPLTRLSLPWEQQSIAQARAQFVRRSPTLAARPFVQGDPMVLLSVIEEKNVQAAAAIASVRATGIMCRSSAHALLLGAGTALYQANQVAQPGVWIGGALALAVGAWIMRQEGRRRAKWSFVKTLESAVWIAGVDVPFGPEGALPSLPTQVASTSAPAPHS